jgi:hypothetical protein
MTQPWQPELLSSPAFFPIQVLLADFKLTHQNTWPDLRAYNQLAAKQTHKITLASGKTLLAVPQQQKSKIFEEGYEPRVYLHGELQTREQCWHDFFNWLVWLTFPKTKAIVNKWQYHSLKNRLATHQPQRTHLENLLTQFDEGGMIVVSSNKSLIDFLKNHQWQDLFWHSREKLKNEMQFYLFGHALYEKLLQPYVGITGNALIFEVTPEFMQDTPQQQLKLLDTLCATYIDNDRWCVGMKTLYHVPVLGIPDWYAENSSANFYENKNYFRPKIIL